jgi:hypothetical protein
MQIRIKTSVEFILNEKEMFRWKESRGSIPVHIRYNKRDQVIPTFNVKNNLEKGKNSINQEDIIL